MSILRAKGLIKHCTKKRCGKLDCNGGDWELYDLATLFPEKLFPLHRTLLVVSTGRLATVDNYLYPEP